MPYIEKISSFLKKTGVKDLSPNILASANALDKQPKPNPNILQTAYSNELPTRRANLKLVLREK